MNKNKAISLCMAAIMAVSMFPMTALASSVGSTKNDTTVGEDTAQGVKTQYSEVGISDAQTEVYLTVDDSDLIVSLPTTVILSGTPTSEGKYVGEYSVVVSGDMSGDKVIKVEPDEIAMLKQNGKDDVFAAIEQEKVSFSYADVTEGRETTTGTVTAEGLTAGSWNSNFNFNISVVADAKIQYTTATYDMFNYNLSSSEIRLDTFAVDEVPNNIYFPKTMKVDGKERRVVLNGQGLFKNNKAVKNVLFEDQIKYFGDGSQMFYNAANLETALFTNNGTFSNVNTLSGNSIISNVPKLKRIFDLTHFTGVTQMFMWNVSSLEDIATLPPNLTEFKFYVTDGVGKLKTITAEFPKTTEAITIQTKNISGDIVINSQKVNNITVTGTTADSYFNDSTLNLIVPNNSDTLNTALKLSARTHTITVSTLDNSEITGFNNIYLLGDSITAGKYYYPILNEKVGSKNILYNYAAESNTATNMLSTTGAKTITVTTSFLIPSKKQKIKINLSDNFCNTKAKVSQSTTGINACTIAGVEGIITYENGNYYFTRSKEGKLVSVKSNTPVVTQFSANYKKGETLVFYIGTNDYSTGMTNSKAQAKALAEKIKQTIAFCNTENYIVVGLAFSCSAAPCSDENSVSYEQVMSKEFGNHFLNLRKYIVENGYSICNDLTIDNTAQQQLDAGIVPNAFFADEGTHWSTYGSKVVAQGIYEKLNELNYLK